MSVLREIGETKGMVYVGWRVSLSTFKKIDFISDYGKCSSRN